MIRSGWGATAGGFKLAKKKGALGRRLGSWNWLRTGGGKMLALWKLANTRARAGFIGGRMGIMMVSDKGDTGDVEDEGVARLSNKMKRVAEEPRVSILPHKIIVKATRVCTMW
jgi:hypothetical protein